MHAVQFKQYFQGNYLMQEGLATEEASAKISILGVCELVARILTAALGDRLPIRQITALTICCLIGTTISFVIGLWPSMHVITAYVIGNITIGSESYFLIYCNGPIILFCTQV